MSRRHPIISITGSSGAGTTSVKKTFENIFRRERVSAAYIEGDAFHRYNRIEMRTTNPYGKTAAQREIVLRDLAEVEPLLRRTCTHEIDATLALADIVARLAQLGRASTARKQPHNFAAEGQPAGRDDLPSRSSNPS